MSILSRRRIVAAMVLFIAIGGCRRGEVPTITPAPVNTPDPVRSDAAPEVQTAPLTDAAPEPAER